MNEWLVMFGTRTRYDFICFIILSFNCHYSYIQETSVVWVVDQMEMGIAFWALKVKSLMMKKRMRMVRMVGVECAVMWWNHGFQNCYAYSYLSMVFVCVMRCLMHWCTDARWCEWLMFLPINSTWVTNVCADKKHMQFSHIDILTCCSSIRCDLTPSWWQWSTTNGPVNGQWSMIQWSSDQWSIIVSMTQWRTVKQIPGEMKVCLCSTRLRLVRFMNPVSWFLHFGGDHHDSLPSFANLRGHRRNPLQCMLYVWQCGPGPGTTVVLSSISIVLPAVMSHRQWLMITNTFF